MELIRGIHNLVNASEGCIVTIGNFDGVHLGHQQIIKKMQSLANDTQLPMVVITFEPQPQEYFQPDKSPARLTRMREKLLLLRHYDVKKVFCLPFTEEIAAFTAEEFIQAILMDALRVKHLIVGDDFRFGRHRSGDLNLLKVAGEQYGFQVICVSRIVYKEERISSTRIREALQQGDLRTAEAMLGRHYSMCGRVAHGDKLGRQWGVPTANILLHRHVSPIFGVYVVQMIGIDAKPINGVANVGNRPTIGGGKSLLEVNLFDFSEDIYGRYVEVIFLHKLRDEEYYDSIDKLREQIHQDVLDAKKYFQHK